ncbi:MAG TPA: apolipoprotein N-acyltransferase, partial [Acidimicrobiia bacterium]|nr:apolipoprotein N-acyltransferase [Acidimicrobiia bacterium]
VALALARPPFDWGPLAAIALVPLFIGWRHRGARGSACDAFIAGLVYHAIAMQWVRFFGGAAVVGLLGALAAYWALAGTVIGWLRRRGVNNPWLTAAVWVIADNAVARWPFHGLSWGEIGYAFHDLAPARAVASVGGLTLVSFLAVALNALLADLIVAGQRGRARWGAQVGVAVIAVAVVGATVTRAEPPVVSTLRVALLQGNDKNRELTDAEEQDRYLAKSHFDLASTVQGPVDLVVFPESSLDGDPRTDSFLRPKLEDTARRLQAWVLANATVDAPPNGAKVLNLNVLFAPDGSEEGTYAKRHLVPFGEYVPFRSLLESWIPQIEKVPRDFESGHRPGLFMIRDTKVATVICFESAFGYEVRPLVRAGAQLLLVSTNNRSYRRSANSAQHLAIGQMRAAETGRPVVQAAISGITGIIDADGVVRAQTPLFERTVVESTVGATSGQTPYVRYGEWALSASLVGLAVAVLMALRRRREAAVVSAAVAPTVSIDDRIAGYDIAPAREEKVDDRTH